MQGYDGSQNRRSLLDVLHCSLKDHPERGGGGNEVHYKLIIDPSEDNSLVQLLMTFKVLDRKKTHVYVCSDFPGDSQLQKVRGREGERRRGRERGREREGEREGEEK